MATDRNDSLLQELSGQLGDIAGLLGEIRDRLPAAQAEEPDAQEPVVDYSEPLFLEEPAVSAEPARKSAGRRATKVKKEAP